MLLLLAALAATPTAQASGLGVEVQASPLLNADAPQLAASLRRVGEKDAYVGVEGRFGTDGDWTGRVGLGFDAFGASAFDLKLGGFVGGTGLGTTRDSELVLGSEVGVGAELGRVYARYRWLNGIGTDRLAELHTEHEALVGFRVISELRVFGQWTLTDPAASPRETLLGIGAAYYF